MRELALQVPAGAVEEVLDELLLVAPHGVVEVPRGDEVELRVRGEAPRADVLAVGRTWDVAVRERDVPDDPHARRLADYEPLVVAQRLVVRPVWAPPAPPGVLEVVLADDAAFGAGTHPTTRMCLEALCAAEPEGALLDLGCGSGVLSIAAALLGWQRVVAVDRSHQALAATASNARSSGASVETREGDVAALAGTPAALVVANLPLPAHAAIAEQLRAPPPLMLASGVQEPDADACSQDYANAGLEETDRRVAGGWVLITLRPRP